MENELELTFENEVNVYLPQVIADEHKRKANERDRIANEEVRVANEEVRVANELVRESNEADRQKATEEAIADMTRRFEELKVDDGLGVPIGGKAGQVLAKKSDEDNDTEWKDIKTDIKAEIYNAIFPIGYTFIDIVGETDYSNHLGFTWERTLKGVSPVGIDENDEDFKTIGKTGGKKTLTLKKENLPNYVLYNKSHSHLHPYSLIGNNGIKATSYVEGETNTYYQVGMTSKSTDSATITVTSGGSDTPINILSPYQVVTFWTRVS